MPLTDVLSQWRVAMQRLGNSAAVPLGAQAQTIAEAEKRLGIQLPDSYRFFLSMHNGWPAPDESIGRLLPVERLVVLSDEDAASLAMLMDQRTALSPALLEKWVTAHRGRLVQIAEYADGYLLLNTARPTSKGECETCFVAAWIPGTQRYRSFSTFMKRKWETFQAAHPALPGEGSATRHLNLKRPPDPEDQIRDPDQFVSELLRLGYFQYTDDSSRERAIEEYRKRFARCLPRGLLTTGSLNSPTLPLLAPSIRRCVWLVEAELLKRRAEYALSELGKLLKWIGNELPPVVEEHTESSYAASLGDVHHSFFKMKKGMPARSGGSLANNAARYYAYESAKLATKFLRSVGSDLRIATVELVRESHEDGVDIGFVCLTDDLSYLLAWTSAIGNECRPARPDVWV